MEWTCRCRAFSCEVNPARGIRAVCYCASCREFAIRTGAEAALDASGGSDLYPVAPENVVILKGADKLARMKLTEKGPVRWFTTCCKTPVANTLGTPKIPFVTLQTHRFADPNALGPVRVRLFRDGATSETPDDGMSKYAFYWHFARSALRSRLTGGWKRNPFFGADGKPIGTRGEPAVSGG